MRAVIQRVSEAEVRVKGRCVGRIQRGILVLLGVARGDTRKEAEFLARKIPQLRIFPDDKKPMNVSLMDIGGEILVVSQFTLLGDCRKGRRPSFTKAADPETGEALYDFFIDRIRSQGVPVQTGVFGAMMDVSLVNNGPVTFVLDSNSYQRSDDSFGTPAG